MGKKLKSVKEFCVHCMAKAEKDIALVKDDPLAQERAEVRLHTLKAVLEIIEEAETGWLWTSDAEREETEPTYFTDPRDGQRCRTVKMPDGKVWMAENLDYETENSWVYDNRYGRLYTWDAAMEACPAGWHLPTLEEWAALVEACGGANVAGKRLKSKSGWNDNGNGTDEYGFSALPSGYRNYYGGCFTDAGYYGNWWSATEYGSSRAYNRGMYYNGNHVDEDWDGKSNGFSVRCVRDEAAK